MRKEKVDGGEKIGLKLLMCTDLRVTLKSRGLLISGLKADLVLQMKISLESERDDFVVDDANGGEDTGDTILTTIVIPVLDGTL